jgi:hypothetical protein
VQGLTLDTGALIALERGEQRMMALLDRMVMLSGAVIHIPAGVVAQAFRNGARQVYLRRLMKKPQAKVVALDEQTAYVAGMLLGRRGASDVIDASVIVCARRYDQAIVTGDPDDLRQLDAGVKLHAI